MWNSGVMRNSVKNFGGNVRFQPGEIYSPGSVDALLEKLSETTAKTIRVIGSKHAWNDGIKTDELLVDLQHLNTIQVESVDEQEMVRVGGGCVMRDLVDELNRQNLALPTTGLILEQTIAGASATGTHGSGRPSVSNFLHAVRIVHFRDGLPTATWIERGDELRAARCSLGCLGIVVEVLIPVIPAYHVIEDTVKCRSLNEALKHEQSHPLQQIFVLPLGWQVYAQRRKTTQRKMRSPSSWLYRQYWNFGLCFCFIALLKLILCLPGSPTILRFYYRFVAPQLLITNWKVSDRADRLMVIRHETFRHLEIELFVPCSDLEAAFELLVDLLSLTDDNQHALSKHATSLLQQHGLLGQAGRIAGTYTHHCPICIRKVLGDDTLISMSAGQQDWYAISLITYQQPRESFCQMATLIANIFHAAFRCRAHWGKWLPYAGEEIVLQYAGLNRFRGICQRFDADQRFQNDFTESSLGIEKSDSGSVTCRSSEQASRNIRKVIL